MKNNKENYFKSKVHIDYIREYRPSIFNSNIKQFADINNIYISRFPVIIRGDGTVWDYASIYFNHLLIVQNRSCSLLESVASDLVDFQRFLEKYSLHMLNLPPKAEKRVTHLYHKTLLTRIRERSLSSSTAKQRMNRILRFYDFLLEENIFNNDDLKNRPYTQIKTRIRIVNDFGEQYEKEVLSSDLRIRSSAQTSYGDEIRDGGRLHPLEPEEKQIFLRYLDNHGARDFQLICFLALYTGARIQTICTFRISQIKDLIKNATPFAKDNTYVLRVGGRSIIDTKWGYAIDLFIPAWLVNDIYNYTQSQDWKKRAASSYYGNSDNNYVFLTKRGNPYYTSRAEIDDRNNNVLKTNKNSIHRGHAVYQMLLKIIKIMKQNKEEIRVFSIHDFRATYGVDLIRTLSKEVVDIDQIIPYVQKRMGHRNINSTIHYLRYVAFAPRNEILDGKFQEILNRYELK